MGITCAGAQRGGHHLRLEPAVRVRVRARARARDRVRVGVGVRVRLRLGPYLPPISALSQRLRHESSMSRISRSCWRRYGGDMAEIWRRYGGDMAEIWRRYGGDMAEIWRRCRGPAAPGGVGARGRVRARG